MGMGAKVGILGVIAVVFFGFMIGMGVLGFHNTEVAMRAQYEAKTDANKADFDNVWKTISQVAQVPAKYKDDFQEVFTAYMEARKGGTDGQTGLLNWVKEAVPAYEGQQLYAKVQTVVESKREAWTTRQKELRDIKREHDTMLRQFPGAFYNVFLGRPELDVVLVTSAKTDEAFTTGQDEDVDLF